MGHARCSAAVRRGVVCALHSVPHAGCRTQSSSTARRRRRDRRRRRPTGRRWQPGGGQPSSRPVPARCGQRRPAAGRRDPVDPAGSADAAAHPAGRGRLAGRPRRAVPAGRARRGRRWPAPSWPTRCTWTRAGCEPGREYFYRFQALGEMSPVGRTRTAPRAVGRPVAAAVRRSSNCQDFQNGYWPAYNGLADEDLDVVLHLGDYIYEYDPQQPLRRPPPHHAGDARPRPVAHAGRLPGPARPVQDAIRRCRPRTPRSRGWSPGTTTRPRTTTPTLIDEIDDTGAAAADAASSSPRQRAAAYQAYYEHMPIRANLRPGSADLRIFRRFDFGRLARFNVLDTRQYRTDQPGGFPGDFGLPAAGTGNTDGTLTGEDQERWLADGLDRSPARWNVIAQQVMMSRTLFPNPTAGAADAGQPRPVGRLRAAAHPPAAAARRRAAWPTRSCSPATSTRPGSAS